MLNLLGMSFSYSSIAAIIFLAICLLVGAWRGLLRTLFGMVAIALSIVATIFISPQLYPVFAKMSVFVNMGAAGAKLATFISTILVSVVTYILLKIIFFFVNRALSGIPILGSVNRILGAVFSCVLGYLIISFVFYIFTLLSSVSFFGNIVADASKDAFGIHLTQTNVITQILNALAEKNPKILDFVNAMNGLFANASASK